MKNRLKEERRRLKLTQQELANEVEVSRQTINSIELGKYIPSTLLALKLAKIFDKDVRQLFELESKDWKAQ